MKTRPQFPCSGRSRCGRHACPASSAARWCDFRDVDWQTKRLVTNPIPRHQARPGRVLWLCFLVTVLGACDHPVQNAEPPVLPASSPDMSGQPANPQAREQQPTVLSTEEVNAIRQEVERCGGELVCNREGQPVKVNLARARVSADDIAFDAVLQCSDLRELSLRAQQLSAKSLSRLPSLMSLEVLSLEAASVDRDTLNFSLIQLPHLRELSLRALPQVRSHTLVSVAGLPELEKLSLISLPLDEGVISAIAAAPGLKSLDLRLCTGFASSDLNVLTKTPQLTDLKLGGPIIDNKACPSRGQTSSPGTPHHRGRAN
jgi:hypothetical protein